MKWNAWSVLVPYDIVNCHAVNSEKLHVANISLTFTDGKIPLVWL
jgi:hypothetical protein